MDKSELRLNVIALERRAVGKHSAWWISVLYARLAEPLQGEDYRNILCYGLGQVFLRIAQED